MNKNLIFIFIAIIFSCSTIPESETIVKKNGVYIEAMKSKMVVKGKVNEKETQYINIYLPPEYFLQPDKRFPVVYFLPGFGVTNNQITRRSVSINNFYAKSDKPQFIFVEPNAQSALGGGFYWNSVASGNWEDYIVKEVIPLIDSKYRTLNSRESRGLAGFSMGGTGTINLGLKYPDLFNAIYAFSPGILADNDLDNLVKSWGKDLTYFRSYGAASSPNLDLDYPYAEFPDSDISRDNWYLIFGDQRNKIKEYLTKPNKLKAIKIEANNNDSYKWIVTGCMDMDRILTEYNIEHISVFGEGGHSLPYLLVEDNLINFFSENLDY